MLLPNRQVSFAAKAEQATECVRDRVLRRLTEERALKIREKVLGPDHVTVTECLDELATLYWTEGKSAQAEPVSQRAAGIRASIKEARPTENK